jgi:predicted 2-oxoglutarate/Fe(II)-dependent dioxygenase YbiX
MTLIAQLSKSSEYKGGNFEIEGLTLPLFARDKGTIILMKPHLKHQVTPILKGVRHSMITWYQNIKI